MHIPTKSGGSQVVITFGEGGRRAWEGSTGLQDAKILFLGLGGGDW